MLNYTHFQRVYPWQVYHEYLVLSAMAQDYLAVPGSSAPSEHVFSYAGCTDSDPRHRNLDAEKFSTMQRLKEAYHDGCISAQSEAWMEIGPCFDDENWDIE